MRKMNTTTSSTKRHAQRVEADRAELAECLARALPRDGVAEPQPGLYISRFARPHDLVHGFLDPCFCVIAQGAKALTFGGEVFRYNPATYMISTLGLPMTAEVVEASPEKPYLGLRLGLDPSAVAQVLVESGAAQPREGGVSAVNVSPLDAELLDAVVRLIRLLDKPSDYRALSPLIVRELVYRLLSGAQGSRMRHLATFGGQAHRMVRAVAKLRKDFDKPLRIEAVARELGMSASGFHAHFKAVTAMSPLQFQKNVRLQEARRLMISENLDAGEAGYKVGYEDPAYFSRDYKKHFGAPPVRDVERMRESATA